MKAEYVEHMGSDLSVVNAARVSFDKKSEWVACIKHNTTDFSKCECDCLNMCDHMGGPGCLSQADTKLINYLAKHNHWTPFAHPQITLRMGAPVPIRTQCFKHKQGFVENEESRRYIKSEPQVYYPDVWRGAPVGGAKQGSSDPIEDQKTAEWTYDEVVGQAFNGYRKLLELGICPEQARFILPQGCMVNWIWTGSLAAYARFYRQRTDTHAQKEIQMLAEKVGAIIEPLFPVSWKALTQ